MLDMFGDALASAPNRDLIVYFETPLTVARVAELSDAFAVGLADLGVRRGDRVALYLQNVPQFPIALLGIWKLGAVAALCNPMLMRQELSKQLDDSGSVALVCLESLYRTVAASAAHDTGVRSVITTSELEFLDDEPPEMLRDHRTDRPVNTCDFSTMLRDNAGRHPGPISLGPGDVAVLTYTSGTTGPAKGAMNTHGNMVFTSHVYREWLHVDSEDVILGIAPLFHITGLIAHLGLGMCVPVPTVLAYRFEPGEVCRLIERHRATTTVAAITAYLSLANSPALAEHDISSLQKAYSGGAPIPPSVVDDFERRTGIVIRSAYGLTETTSPTHLTPSARRAPADPETSALSAGIPVFNTRARIVDEAGESLPDGQVGEVVLSGPQVVPGYWNRPEETERAIRNRELYTGDVGKVDADGWLYLVDRKKDLIIASGYKIWPREVEDVVYLHPAVQEAAVVGLPDPYRGETVKAFVTVKSGRTVDPEDLLAFCRERLAAYKCPRSVEVVDALPKTESGKIMRRSLRP
jgi:long-chain acyl-CoA synthetase